MDDCEKCNPTGQRQAKCSDCEESGPAAELVNGLCPGCVEFERRPPAADPPRDTDFPYIQPFKGDPDGHPREGLT